MINTTQFTLSIGVNPGYFHNNNKKDIVTTVTKLWNDLAEKTFEETGVYVSCTVHQTKTLYREAWGCPSGGEDTVVVQGIRNPKYSPDEHIWFDAVHKVSFALAKKLDQATAYLYFSQVLFNYIETK